MCMSTAPSPSRQYDLARGTSQRDAERDLRAVPHRADREEVAPVPLAPVVRGRHRPRARSCRSSRRRRPRRRAVRARARPPPLAWASASSGSRAARSCAANVPCPDEQRMRASPSAAISRSDPRERARRDPRVGVEHVVLEAERREQRLHSAALHDVLRLVGDAGLAAPADQEQDGDPVDRRIEEREQRVDDVADAGVLQVDDGQLARSRGGSRRRARSRVPSFALMTWRSAGTASVDVGAEILEERVGNAGEEREAVRAKRVVEVGRVDHAPPGMSRSTSPMGSISPSLSCERPCSRIERAVAAMAG